MIANAEAIGALDGLGALSKLGSKKDEAVKRLAQMLIWCKKATEEYFVQRDLTTETWAERDPETNEIVVVKSDDGKTQSPKMRNGIEHNLAMNKLLREPVSIDAEPPAPFTFDELLLLFNKKPEAHVIANLGPFVTFGDVKQPTS